MTRQQAIWASFGIEEPPGLTEECAHLAVGHPVQGPAPLGAALHEAAPHQTAQVLRDPALGGAKASHQLHLVYAIRFGLTVEDPGRHLGSLSDHERGPQVGGPVLQRRRQGPLLLRGMKCYRDDEARASMSENPASPTKGLLGLLVASVALCCALPVLVGAGIAVGAAAWRWAALSWPRSNRERRDAVGLRVCATSKPPAAAGTVGVAVKKALVVLLITVVVVTGLPTLMAMSGMPTCDDCGPAVGFACTVGILATGVALTPVLLAQRQRLRRESIRLLIHAFLLERPPRLA